MKTKTEFNATVIQSIEAIRQQLNLSQERFADRLGMSLSGYKKLIYGETDKIDAYTIYVLCKLTKKYLFELCNDDNDGMGFIKDISKLSKPQKYFIKSIVDFERNISKETSDIVEIPCMTLTGDMYDGMIFDSVNLNMINISGYEHLSPHCAIKVTSNHLHPVYHEGDVLLISREPPRNGDTGVFINKETNRAFLRKFYQNRPCRLVPINDYGIEFTVDPSNVVDMEKWVKFGKVLTKLRRVDNGE